MQYLFGIAAPPEATGRFWAQLAALTSESNPGLQAHVERGAYLQLGVVSRAFATWRGEGLRLFLDGEILYLDDVPITRRGHSADELARVAQLYRRYGAAVWEHLDGNFCLVIEDGHDVRIGVDLAGNRTLYYWLHDGVLAFHTHFLDLAPLYPGTLHDDLESLSVFLGSGANLPGRTALREVKHLSPACHLLLRDGKVTIEEHFRLSFHPAGQPRSRDQLIEELGELLGEAVAVAWQAAERPVLPLSGGQDSRFIVAELARRVGDRSLLRTITWGSNPELAGSDAQVARQVAAQLGVENVWHEKTQDHLDTEFARSLYLSSGEADAPITYADDPILYDDLAYHWGFASMFRGETVFAPLRPLFTARAVLAENSIIRLTPASGYRSLLGDELFAQLLDANHVALDALVGGLRSPTPTGKRTELYYGFRSRQVLGTYHKIKNAYLEVYSPLLSRRVLEWIRGMPDRAIYKPDLFTRMLHRRFPELADIPDATTSNLPPWQARFRSEPALSRFYREWCAAPGWLDAIGAQARVVAAWDAMERAARNKPDATRSHPRAPLKERVKETLPGRLLRETILERRLIARQPRFLLLARLAVLHGLLGRIHSRRAAPDPGAASPPLLSAQSALLPQSARRQRH